VETMLHVVPFHSSLKVLSVSSNVSALYPEAMQKAEPVHETDCSHVLWPLTLGEVSTPQVLPFHSSARLLTLGPPEYDVPTAMQKVVLRQRTAAGLRLLLVSLTMLQVEPFHRTMSSSPPLNPTAMQKLALVQLTPDSCMSVVLLGAGTVCWLQALPFHSRLKG